MAINNDFCQLNVNPAPGAEISIKQSSIYEELGKPLINGFNYGFIWTTPKKDKPVLGSSSLFISKSKMEAIVRIACEYLADRPVNSTLYYRYSGVEYFAWVEAVKKAGRPPTQKLQIIQLQNNVLNEGGFGVVEKVIKINSATQIAMKRFKIDNACGIVELSTRMNTLYRKMIEKKGELYTNLQGSVDQAILDLLFQGDTIPLVKSKGHAIYSNRQQRAGVIFMQLCQFNLKQFIKVAEGCPEMVSLPLLAANILLALCLLQMCGYGHGDIKLENFLVERYTSKMVVKLGDLDNIFKLPVGDEPIPEKRIGSHTPDYLDIDNCVLLEEAKTADQYTKYYQRRDGIAVGRVLYSLFSGCRPRTDKEKGIYNSVRTLTNQDIGGDLTSEQKQFILDLMNGVQVDLLAACISFAGSYCSKNKKT